MKSPARKFFENFVGGMVVVLFLSLITLGPSILFANLALAFAPELVWIATAFGVPVSGGLWIAIAEAFSEDDSFNKEAV